MVPIYKLMNLASNELFVMRDDLIPYSFGGNKVRKAMLFFQEIEKGNYDTVVTYGSSSSNHCRIIANMAAARGMHCHIISTESDENAINRKMVALFHADITVCDVTDVAQTIARVMNGYSANGRKAYFCLELNNPTPKNPSTRPYAM